MEEDELLNFRKRWKEELNKKTQAESTGSGNFGPHKAQPSVTLDANVKVTCFKDSYKDGVPLKDNERGNCSGLSGHDDSPGRSHQDREVKDTALLEALEERAKHQPQYVSIAESLLGGRTSPLVNRIKEERTRRKRQHGNADCHYSQQPQKKVTTEKKLLDQFIQDLVRHMSNY